MKLEKKKRCTETKEFVLVSHLFKFLKELEFQELEFHFSILRRTQIFKIWVPHGILNYKMSNQLLPPCHIFLELDFYKLEFQNSGKLLKFRKQWLITKYFGQR